MALDVLWAFLVSGSQAWGPLGQFALQLLPHIFYTRPRDLHPIFFMVVMP
jgi:hypothetical protein